MRAIFRYSIDYRFHVFAIFRRHFTITTPLFCRRCHTLRSSYHRCRFHAAFALPALRLPPAAGFFTPCRRCAILPLYNVYCRRHHFTL